jgi:hypothetical protein
MRERPGGVIIIWGFKTVAHLLGMTTLVCNQCGNPAAHRAEKLIRKFTLFWIPLFTVKERALLTCAFCGVTQEVPKDRVPALLNELHVLLSPQSGPKPGIASPGVPSQGRPGSGIDR